MKAKQYSVNEKGLSEIKEFLADNHKKGGDHFTPGILLVLRVGVANNGGSGQG